MQSSYFTYCVDAVGGKETWSSWDFSRSHTIVLYSTELQGIGISEMAFRKYTIHNYTLLVDLGLPCSFHYLPHAIATVVP